MKKIRLRRFADGSMMKPRVIPDNGIAPGTKFEDLPDDFVCPLCGAGKDSFSEEA